MEYIEMIFDYMERHPFTTTFVFVGFGIGYCLDALYNKKDEPVTIYLNNKEEN